MYVCICTCTYTAACRKDLINEGIGRARWLAPVLPARFGRPRRADHEVRSSRPAWPIWCNSVLNATDNPGGGGSSESSKAPLPSSLGERPRLPLQKKKRKSNGPERWFLPVIPALWEAEVRNLQGQEFETSLANIVKPRLYQKYKTNKLGMVACACSPSYSGG